MLKTYFSNCNNFGDKLNREIFSEIFGINIEKASRRNTKILAIGSLLDDFLYLKREFIFSKALNFLPFLKNSKPLYILSSGFGFDNFENPMRAKKYLTPRTFCRNLKPVALRGKLTKIQLEKILKSRFDDVILADGGLLASELLKKNIEKKYRLGIIPHYADFNQSTFAKIKNSISESKILDVQQEPRKFLEELAQCQTVVSTAMHPLIACDALGIPNIWGRISENTTSYYKFLDYYSAFDITKTPLRLNENPLAFDNNLPNFIEDSYDIKKAVVEEKKRELKKAFSSLLMSIENQ